MTTPSFLRGRSGRAPGTRTVLAVLAVLLLIVGLAVALVARDDSPCVPTTEQDCGCHGDTTGRGLIGEYTEHTYTLGRRSSTYRVYDTGVDRTEPVGVLVRLHGDGAYEYDHSPTFVACLATIAASRNLVLVIPRSPSRDLTWWTRLDRNVDWLSAFQRDRVLTLEGVDPQRVWWMGYSGGAEMITYGLLPTQGDLVTGGALMLGGGGAPSSGLGAGTVPASRRTDLPLTWVTGMHDDGSDPAAEFDALSAAHAGAAFYREAGFSSTVTDFARDEDHFTLDQVAILHDQLSVRELSATPE